MTRQPYMRRRDYRVVGELTRADLVTTNTFWLGVFPGLTESHLTYVADAIGALLRGQGRGAIAVAPAAA